MSWSTRTWQPPIRRDGPLIIIAAFFLMPAAYFITAWYADYFSGATPMVVVGSSAAAALLLPTIACYQFAGRAGRRRLLWSFLVFAGSLLSLWLPTRYLVLGGPLPVGSYVALPAALSQVLAATTVSIVPLLTGTIPIVVYGLAVGQDHPLAGIPPRGAVILAAVTGAIFWAVTLFVALLNPVVPPFVNLGERVAVVARVTRPAGLPGEVVPATWSALLWRLHDGALPGATGVRMTEEGLVLQLPAWLESEGLLEPVLGRGRIELVNAGEVPPTPGTSVSTSESPLPGAEETLDTIVSGEQLAQDAHWSGISTGKVALEEGLEASVLTLVLDEAGQETLVRFAEDNQGAFLSLVLDNTALISFPVLGAIDENTLVIRRLDPELAKILAAIMRYGPLPLVPEVEYVRR